MTRLKIFLVLALTAVLFSCATTEATGPRTVVYRADGKKIVTEVTPEKTQTEETVLPASEEPAEETVPVSETQSGSVTAPGSAVQPEPAPADEKKTDVTEVKPEETVIKEETAPVSAAETETVKEEETVVVSIVTDSEKEEITLTSEETVPVTLIEKGDMGNIVNGFNYAYGVKNMNDLKNSGVSIIASYFALGLYDASLNSASPRFLSYPELQDAINDYVAEYYSLGISFDKGERPLTLEELTSLSEPEDLKGLFSYAYGFSIVSDLISGGVDIEIMSFMTGMLDCLYSESSPLTDNEIDNAVNLYIMYLNEEYYQSLENLKEENGKKAEAFLAQNAENEDVTVLESGVQLLVLDEDEVLGGTPTQYDTVLMDYNEYVLDYASGNLEMIDSEFGSEISLMTVSNGLQSAVTNMKVGQAVRAFIPPELSGLADGDGDTIEPNSLIVYDIALNGIL
jgi:FKBP-type peptidyl-prolyl cis-trans isomerase FklB